MRNAPATPISADPATIAPLRSRTTSMPWPSTAAGFSPTIRIARPSGVRYSTHASAGTATSAASVNGVCAERIGRRSAAISANGWIVGGLDTLGNPTRYAKYDRLVASSVMPSPDTCCDSASPTVSAACSSPNAAPAAAATATPAHRSAP